MFEAVHVWAKPGNHSSMSAAEAGPLDERDHQRGTYAYRSSDPSAEPRSAGFLDEPENATDFVITNSIDDVIKVSGAGAGDQWGTETPAWDRAHGPPYHRLRPNGPAAAAAAAATGFPGEDSSIGGIGSSDGGRFCNQTDILFFDGENVSWLNCSSGYNNTLFESEIMYRNPLLGVLLCFFAIFTILGNILVIVAVSRERYLRTVTNYFIVSLALADLIIGSLVMPFSIWMEMTNNFWLFGADWCDVWHSFDVLASSASILNLSMISLDRYWAITDPIAYPSKMSTGRALILIALVWIASASISFPAIIWWRAMLPSPLPPHVCAFTEDSAYLLFSSCVSFYCPITVILFAYYKIYQAASEQMRSLKAGSKVMASEGVNGEVMTLRMHRGGARSRETEHIHYARASANSDSDNESPVHHSHHHQQQHQQHQQPRPPRVVSRKWKNFALSRKLSKIAKEQKAAKTLGIVMGVFCICWVPFFVANVLFGICNLDCISHPDIIFPVFTWLGYLNSGMNPVIYALSMRDFRRAFIKILCCCFPGYIRFRIRKKQCDRSFSTSSYAMTCGERSNVRL